MKCFFGTHTSRGRPWFLPGIAALFLSGLAYSAHGAEINFRPNERSVSASGQFYVYGKSEDGRSVLASKAEELRRAAARLFGMPRAEFTHPIVITMVEQRRLEPGQKEADLNLYNTPGGLKVQLDLIFLAKGPKMDLAVEIIRATLLEMAIAGLTHLPKDTPYALPPDWLAQGIVEWIRVHQNGLPAPVFSGMLEARIPFYDLLSKRMTSLDSTSRALYRAYAYCLIYLLADQPQGRKKLLSLARNAPSYPLGGLEALGEFFPELTESGDSLDKWWLLSVARLASKEESGALNARQTEGRLDNILDIPVVVEGQNRKLTLKDFKEIAKLPNREELLAPVKIRLLQLSGEASPMYGPILGEYDLVLTHLMAGRTKEIDVQLDKLEMFRKLVLERDEQIDDYLNWYEATQPSQRSQAFDGFIQEASRGPDRSPVVRDDSISLYLDAIERELQ